MIVALALAVLLPWLVAMEQRLPGYTWRTIRGEVLERAAKPQEGHSGPPGYYLLTIWGTFLPWSIFLPAAIIGAWRKRSAPEIRFALAAVIGPWIMFEIVQTKLVHYLLPVFPALAFLTANVVVRSASLRRLGAWLGIGMLVFVAIGYGIVIPRLPELRLSKRLAEILVREGATQPGDAIMIDYKETSLAFYQGGTIRPVGDNEFLSHTAPDKWPGWVVISDAIWKRMPESVRSKLELVGTIHGLNYAGDDADGKHLMDVHVARKKGDTLSPPSTRDR